MATVPQRFVGAITKKHQLNASVYCFGITHTKAQKLVFEPGQYMTCIIDEKIRRQYTICSPQNPSSFEIVVDTTPMGPGSQFFLNTKVGQQISYLAPLGHFTLNKTNVPKVFIATGTGIAPFRSMIKTYFSTDHPFDISMHLYWGLRFNHDMYWQEEFDALVGQFKGFQYFFTLSKPEAGWGGNQGYVTDLLFQHEHTLLESEYYLCGNSAMITSLKHRLIEAKVDLEQIKTDLYY